MERLFDYFAPAHYGLDLKINDEKTRISGEAVIRGEVKTETIKLHAVRMEIKTVHIDGTKFESFEHKDGELILPAQTLGEHEYKIKFVSRIEPDMEGAYLSTYEYEGETQKIVATQFESHYARKCFPCVDEPIAKATFSLKLTSDADDVILSNMPAVFTTTQEGKKTVEFAETPRMSTYLLAFAAGKFCAKETTSVHGVKITVYAGLHQNINDLDYAAHFAADVLDYYDDRFKTPFPLPKMDLLALPDFEAGAMENWGLVTFREIALLANEESSLDTKQYVAIVIAHELSHMWFGDLVTMAWWDDLWLNESFANMMEVYSTDKIRPELRAWEDFYLSAVSGSLSRDSLPGVQPVKVEVNNVEEIANLFDGAIVYGKGSHLLLMLMRTMGEEAFFSGLADYFEKHKYGNTVADDLWNALTPYADFDVKEFMTPWLTQSGFPVVTTDGKQTRFLLSGETDDTKYPIRELNDDLAGHYIINYTDEELAAKIADINNMSKEQKLRLLMDRRMLAKTDYVESASLLPLIEGFADETDSVIWEIIAAIVADLKVFFDPKTDEKHQYQAFVRKLAEPSYRRLGAMAKETDTYDDIQLRSTIMGMMLYSGDKEYIADINNIYMKQDIEKVDANLRWVVGSTLIKEHDELSEQYFNIYTTTPDAALKRDLTDAMTNTRNHDIAISYLDKLMDGSIRPQDRLIFFIRLARNYVIKDETLDWMMNNWDWLRKEEGDKTIPDYPRYVANLVRRPEEAEKYKAFFTQYKDDNALARDINVGFAEIDSRLKLIENDREAVYKYLIK